MTEAEWRFSAEDWWNRPVFDLSPWVDFLATFASERKLRLWAAGGLRTMADRLADRRSVAAIDAAERYADGCLGAAALGPVAQAAWEAVNHWEGVGIGTDPDTLTDESFRQSDLHRSAAWAVTGATVEGGLGRVIWESIHAVARPPVLALMHDIFGNPFRPAGFDPRWRSADVVGLARGVYEDRAFDRLPLLADALMDAGCADEAILGHYRGEGPHVRGCWVVDLVLGKG